MQDDWPEEEQMKKAPMMVWYMMESKINLFVQRSRISMLLFWLQPNSLINLHRAVAVHKSFRIVFHIGIQYFLFEYAHNSRLKTTISGLSLCGRLISRCYYCLLGITHNIVSKHTQKHIDA